MAKKNNRVVKKRAIRLFLFGVVSMAIIIVLMVTLSNIGIEIYKKYKEKDQLDKRLSELRESEAKLTVDVERMQDPEYVARYLREKFFYSKDGEYIIRIPSK